MQEEWYEPTPRTQRRVERHLATKEGQEWMAMEMYKAHKILEWRIKNEGFTLPPDEMEEHERIMAKKGKL